MPQKSRDNLLIVYSHPSSFIKEDVKLLNSKFDIEICHFKLEKKVFSFFKYQFKGIFDLLKKNPKTDLVYIWFCDYHAFWAVLLAKLFRKKTIIIIAGYDGVKIPAISFGAFHKENLRTKLIRFAYKNCDKIISVDESLIEGKNTYAGDGAICGIEHFIKNIKQKSMTIPFGFDSKRWKMLEKKKQVLTVASIKTEKVFLRKGIDLYLEVAKKMPDTQFHLIGLQNLDLIPTHLKKLNNVHIKPILKQEKLIDLYAYSKVYCQFSLSEGLPNVLCEAMTSGCIPVGSSVNGIPKAIGNTGFILEEKNISKAVCLVKKALNTDEEFGLKARNRMIKHFCLEFREKALVKTIQEII